MKYLALAAAALAVAGPLHAQTIASSTFDTSDGGWTLGDLETLVTPSAVDYDASLGLISATDSRNSTAFLAPVSYLGNKSGAFGGTLTFLLSDTQNDDPDLYSPISLIGGGLTLFAQGRPGPQPALTPFSITLTGANFKLDTPFGAGGTVATDAQLQTVLASLDQLAILVDWNSGGDFTQLDNVLLAGPNGPTIPGGGGGGAVPEPATWAMMMLGFGLTGVAVRRRRRGVVAA